MPGTLESNKHGNDMSPCLLPYLRDLEAGGGAAWGTCSCLSNRARSPTETSLVRILTPTSSPEAGGNWTNTLPHAQDPRTSWRVNEQESSCVFLFYFVILSQSKVSLWSSHFMLLAWHPSRMNGSKNVHFLLGNMTSINRGVVCPHGPKKSTPQSSAIETSSQIWIC